MVVSCSKFIWITNSSDHRRVWTANLLQTKSLPNPLGHKASHHPSHHHHQHLSLKLGSKLKHLKKTLDGIIGEHLWEAIKNRIILYALSICDITDVSNKVNKNPSVISLELILSYLLYINSDMVINSFIWLKLHTPISNLKLK